MSDTSFTHIASHEIPMTGKSVFLVAVFERCKVPDSSPPSRLWGWYSSFDAAEKAVLENHTDIFEAAYYEMAVIEEIPEGVCAVAKGVWWYRADYPDTSNLSFVESLRVPPSIVKTSPPSWAEGLCNFTL